MTQTEHIKQLKYRKKEEGFHYCFEGYSDWKEIEDEKFHALRKAYLESYKELDSYIENMKLTEFYSEIKTNVGDNTYILHYVLNITDNTYELSSITDSKRYTVYPSYYKDVYKDVEIILEQEAPSLEEIVDNIVDKEGYHKRLQSYGLAE
jgi:hypothetical protein